MCRSTRWPRRVTVRSNGPSVGEEVGVEVDQRSTVRWLDLKLRWLAAGSRAKAAATMPGVTRRYRRPAGDRRRQTGRRRCVIAVADADGVEAGVASADDIAGRRRRPQTSDDADLHDAARRRSRSTVVRDSSTLAARRHPPSPKMTDSERQQATSPQRITSNSSMTEIASSRRPDELEGHEVLLAGRYDDWVGTCLTAPSSRGDIVTAMSTLALVFGADDLESRRSSIPPCRRCRRRCRQSSMTSDQLSQTSQLRRR